ncbi:MAG: UDP-N-acetylmuramoyl-tripeptide--D-alanyl-D-alanine ligase [Candidatus Yanofskybacteria bacterium]|nr:UDP-N-acetylmuramoyl-tripeptide--D-alanyl-D-alanine ligase [Candidatus Yanofskybacteria bacterium]
MYRLSQIIVEILAKLYLWRFRPQIIGITGNVGKTSTKEAIGLVVGRVKKVRIGGGNMNNEIGLPFNIISDSADEYYEKGGSFIFGIKSFFKAIFGFFSSDYPEILVLEYGADKPEDIKKLVGKYKPHIGVITAIGDVPVHVEFFSGPEGVAREKSRLVEALSASDFAVLNFDDLAVLEMKEKTKAKVLTYGFGEGANIKISNFQFLTRLSDGQVSNEKPEGVSFKMNYNDTLHGGGQGFVPFKLEGSLGKSQGYAAAAAAAVGIVFGLNLVDISEAFSEYHGPKGRLKILKGIKNSTIIDDTYNASPLSTHLALETLRDLPGSRKIAVLGDMLELGEYTIKAHQNVGNMAGSFVDLLVCVGSRAKFIADSARRSLGEGGSERIFMFETSDEAKLKVKELVKDPPAGEAGGDLILVKGSQGMRMEKIVEEIMADPPAGGEKKKELLVRQSKKWLLK